jgi:type VI secretion system protein ImpH
VSTLKDEASDDGVLTELRVSFLGLIGQSGVLPQHYTTEVIDRSNEQDHALRDFMDIFHHRAISLFYQAWRKYRLPMVIERRLRTAGEEHGTEHGAEHGAETEDAFTMALRSLVGLGTHGVRRRMAAPDEAVLYYAGHDSHAPRSAVGLERVLADFFRLPAEIVPFIGRWLILPPSERTCMPSQCRLGRNFQVGSDALVGGRVWEIQTRFRVRLGPMNYQQFQEFTPPGRGMKRLSDLVRLYIGPAFEFEVQPVLQREEVPVAQLGKAGGPRSNVGWNAWLKKGQRTADAEEAIFQPAGSS